MSEILIRLRRKHDLKVKVFEFDGHCLEFQTSLSLCYCLFSEKGSNGGYKFHVNHEYKHI